MKFNIEDRFERPLRDLRISVIDRCNFRCPYCMPKERYNENYEFLSQKEFLVFEEIERLTKLFARAGVSRIRLTGGEPLLRKNLDELIDRIRQIEEITDISLTTNGYLLKEYAGALKDAGLNRITVSLDSLDDDVFGTMNGMGIGTRKTLEGIERAADVGLNPVKINVVVQRHINDDSVMNLVKYFRKTGHIVRFIEYMDVGTCNRWNYAEVVPSAEIKERIEREYPLIPLKRRFAGEVAERYAFADGGGEIGFISSVTQPFCRDCSRARISADGHLYTCLFATEGTDLKPLLRNGTTDEEIYNTIVSMWRRRIDRYSEERNRENPPESGRNNRIEMYHIGG